MAKRIKISAGIGLLSAAVLLTTGCQKKEVNEIKFDGVILSEEQVSEINEKIAQIDINYNYENVYLTEETMSLFMHDQDVDVECNGKMPNDTIENITGTIIENIKKNSLKYEEDIKKNGFEYLDDEKIYDAMYSAISKIINETEEEERDNVYCIFSNLIIAKRDTASNKSAMSGLIEGYDPENNETVYLPTIVFSNSFLNNDILAKVGNDYEIFKIFTTLTATHESIHITQNNCPCYYKYNSHYMNKGELIDFGELPVSTNFINESGATLLSEEYVDGDEILYTYQVETYYPEEINTLNLLETSMIFREDYGSKDLLQNEVARNNKKLAGWLEITTDEEYKELYNILAVLNLTNTNNSAAFETVTNIKYDNQEDLKAHTTLVRSDAILNLALHSYQNLIEFNEKENLSKETFCFLLGSIQNYYLDQACYLGNDKFYWSDEFTEKFTLANEYIFSYVKQKYNITTEMSYKESYQDYFNFVDLDKIYDKSGKELNEKLGFDKYQQNLEKTLKTKQKSIMLNSFYNYSHSLDEYLESKNIR